jgi:hypothetical protein
VSRAEPPDPAVLAGLDEDEAAVAERFFKGRRLVEIPAAEGKRRAVLRILLDEFEPGRYYAAAEVRRILRKYHPDDAALRRYLVDEGMLVRENRTRTYWRGGGPPPSGGAVDPPTARGSGPVQANCDSNLAQSRGGRRCAQGRACSS